MSEPRDAESRRPRRHRRRRRLSSVGLVLLTLLAVAGLGGCVKVDADITVAKNRVSGTYVVGLLETDTAPGQTSLGPPPPPTADSPRIKTEPYEDDKYSGYEITFDQAQFDDVASVTPLGDQGGALRFERNGDTISLTATYDFTDEGNRTPEEIEQIASTFDAVVRITFPGPVLDTNGNADGDTVTWTLEPFKTTEITATAEAAVAGSGLERSIWGLPLWAWLVIGVVAIAALAGLLVWAFRRGRGRPDRLSAQRTDAGLPILGGDPSASQPSGGYGFAASGGYSAGYGLPGVPGGTEPPGQPWGTPGSPAGPPLAWEVQQDPGRPASPPQPQTAPPVPPAPPVPQATPAPQAPPAWVPASDATQAVSMYAMPPPPPVVEPDDIPPAPPPAAEEPEPPTESRVKSRAAPAPEPAADVPSSRGGWPPPTPIWEDED